MLRKQNLYATVFGAKSITPQPQSHASHLAIQGFTFERREAMAQLFGRVQSIQQGWFQGLALFIRFNGGHRRVNSTQESGQQSIFHTFEVFVIQFLQDPAQIGPIREPARKEVIVEFEFRPLFRLFPWAQITSLAFPNL